ncbi:MAG: GGDEF domain-containing protein [Lachnospiraceae bacterium]|nr:GGDEF domain-containing protein [Lachnospiraceae bacterium]
MKKFDFVKTVQLIIFTVFALVCIGLVLFNKELFHAIALNPTMRLICGLLWFCFGLAFVFIFIDFNFISSYKRDYHELEHAVNTDHISGLANRKSIDEFIEKYRNECFPCITLTPTNIQEINKTSGRAAGDDAIREFSNILMMSSVGLCSFVGRNDGLNFLAFFEKNASREDLDQFLKNVEGRMASHNIINPQKSVSYQYGVAFDEGDNAKTITDMIRISAQRVQKD